jgi:hypothetical protein
MDPLNEKMTPRSSNVFGVETAEKDFLREQILIFIAIKKEEYMLHY